DTKHLFVLGLEYRFAQYCVRSYSTKPSNMRIKLAAIIIGFACKASALAQSPLSNLSTRGFVGTGDFVLIAGGIITGTTPKPIIVRALGPSLVNFGVQIVLADPVMEIHDSNGTLIDSNDDWVDDANASQVLALGYAPTSALEAAIYRPSVLPGAYTV